MTNKVHVLALSGSMCRDSQTSKALACAVEGAQDVGAEVTVVDLSTWPLPFFDGERSEDATLVRFKAAAEAADGFIIATPVYHESMSGAVKNAIDHLYAELQGKVAGLIAVAGGRGGGDFMALSHLRTVLRETQTWVLPRQVGVGQSREAFDPTGRPIDDEIRTRLSVLGKEIALRAKVFRPRSRATGGS